MKETPFQNRLKELKHHRNWLDLPRKKKKELPPSWVLRIRNHPLDLSPEQLQKLRRMGFDFGRPDNLWIDRYLELWRFQRRHSHCLVRDHRGKRTALGRWIIKQRGRHRRDTLPLKRQQALNRLGFCWKLQPTWEERIAVLKAFIAKHGHAHPPGGRKRGKFGIWVAHMRQHRDQLSPKKRRELDESGFVWKAHEASWEANLKELKAFHRRFGHGNIPNTNREYPGAVAMVVAARRTHRAGRLSLDKVKKLEALGIDWNPTETIWQTRFRELAAAFRRLKHTTLPRDWLENPTLYRWMKCQREHFDRLPREKQKMLLRIGFHPRPSLLKRKRRRL